MPGPAIDLLLAIDQADDVVHHAQPVPLTDQVRIDPRRLQTAATDIRAALGNQAAQKADARDFVAALERFEELAAGPRVPLTKQVRVERLEAYELLDRMKRSLPKSAQEAQWRLAEDQAITEHGPEKGRRVVAERRRGYEASVELLNLWGEVREAMPGDRPRAFGRERIEQVDEVLRKIRLMRELVPPSLALDDPRRTERIQAATASLDRVAAALEAGRDREVRSRAKVSHKRARALVDEIGAAVEAVYAPIPDP